MGLITERSEWVDAVYLIELTDPVLGGENGINNIQAKQLANRTIFLKDLFENHHTSDGYHRLRNEDFAEHADIDESKLALDHSTAALKSISDNTRSVNVVVNERLDDVIGIKGSMVSALGKAVPLSWQYSERGFEFDMFTSLFNYVDEKKVAVTRAIAGDDSIDVEDTSLLKIGNTYVLYDDYGNDVEAVVLKQVLTNTRAILSAPVTITRSSGFISQTSWEVGIGKALVKNGGIHITKKITILENHKEGRFFVRVKQGGSHVIPYYRVETEENADWVQGEFIESLQYVDGYNDIVYAISGGVIRLKLVVVTPNPSTIGEIVHMCVLPAKASITAESVKQPKCITPFANETNASITDLISSPYRSLYGVAHKASHYQISINQSFTDLVLDQVTDTPVTTIETPALELNRSFFWRVRYQDIENVWSRWSDIVNFFTGEVLGQVNKPNNLAPSNNSKGISHQVLLTSGAFSSTYADTHAYSRWQVATDPEFITIVHDSDQVEDLTSYLLPLNVTLPNTKYYWRVKHRGTLLGWSEWSSNTYFTTGINVIGICYYKAAGGVGTWKHIDINGDEITVDLDVFNYHPVYSGIQAAVYDTQILMEIPKFYYKVGTLSDGPFTGAKYWYISESPISGFKVHPGFKNAGVEIPKFYFGKYQAGDENGTKATSVDGVMPLTDIDFSTMQSRCASRGAGFSMLDIHKLSAIQMLMLVELGNADAQAYLGSGNVDSSGVVANNHTLNMQASWRGITGLWGNVRQMIAGIKTYSGKLYIWDTNGNKTWIEASNISNVSGYIGDFDQTIAEGSAFIGTPLVEAIGDAAKVDQQVFNSGPLSENIGCFGGAYNYGNKAGIFCLDLSFSKDYHSMLIGSRLVKI